MTSIPFIEVAASIGFTEGPQWRGDDTLFATAMSRGVVVALDANAPGTVLHEIETGGGPNGLALADDGSLFVAQNGSVSHPSRSSRPVAPGLQRIDVDGSVEDVVVEGCESPNDLVIGPDGAIWFTDPGPYDGSAIEPSVKRWHPQTNELSTVATGFAYPNGLAFSSQADALFVADSTRHRIIRHAYRDGALDPDGTVFIDLLAASPSDRAYPDGVAVDRAGRLWIAALEAHEFVVADGASGAVLGRLDVGEGSRPTNVCFGGEDGGRVFATLSKGGRVIEFPIEQAAF